jgi:hypothetical protein
MVVMSDDECWWNLFTQQDQFAYVSGRYSNLSTDVDMKLVDFVPGALGPSLWKPLSLATACKWKLIIRWHSSLIFVSYCCWHLSCTCRSTSSSSWGTPLMPRFGCCQTIECWSWGFFLAVSRILVSCWFDCNIQLLPRFKLLFCTSNNIGLSARQYY